MSQHTRRFLLGLLAGAAATPAAATVATGRKILGKVIPGSAPEPDPELKQAAREFNDELTAIQDRLEVQVAGIREEIRREAENAIVAANPLPSPSSRPDLAYYDPADPRQALVIDGVTVPCFGWEIFALSDHGYERLGGRDFPSEFRRRGTEIEIRSAFFRTPTHADSLTDQKERVVEMYFGNEGHYYRARGVFESVKHRLGPQSGRKMPDILTDMRLLVSGRVEHLVGTPPKLRRKRLRDLDRAQFTAAEELTT